MLLYKTKIIFNLYFLFINIVASAPLQELLQSLAAETGKSVSDLTSQTKLRQEKGSSDLGLIATSSFEDNLHLERLPLSEEDLLKKPFYTVEGTSSHGGDSELPQGKFLHVLYSLHSKDSFKSI